MAQVARRKRSSPGQQASAEASDANVVPVVAIGASAGGLEPIGEFLAAMKSNAGVGIVVIQHLDPTSKSILPQLLARHSTLDVSLAEDGAAVRPNHVYVIPPGIFLSIASGRLQFSPAHSGPGARMPIDAFLRSLAADRGRHGIGIIMSGTGMDGADGLKALKEAGGLALVQDPGEAQQDGMPRQAILTARPDYVLPVREMVDILERYVGHDYIKSGGPAAPIQATQAVATIELAPFLEFLKARAGPDFFHYKTGTVQRRLERRMALNGVASWTDYLALLRGNATEADALAGDLLITVTSFFRDPEAFAAVGELLPELLSSHAADQPFRIWVVGCSTGEEAYSLGILALERLTAARRHLELQIFATDVDDESLQFARGGLYPASIQDDLTPERLRQFFVAESGQFRIAPELRKAVIFSRHDALADPPFSRLDLVSCRNVLIYLLPEAQRRLLGLLHFALRDGGVLFLGAAESPGTAQVLFEPVNDRLRIYRRRGERRLVGAEFRTLEPLRLSPAPVRPPPPPRQPQPSLQELVHGTMLQKYAPAAVVTNRQLMPLYFFGGTDRYLQIAAGEPNQDLLLMAREGLGSKLHDIITRAFRGKRRIAAHGMWFKRDGKPATVTIEAQQINDAPGDVVLVSFIDELPAPHKAARSRGRREGSDAELDRLRQQLTDARRDLNRTIQELRAANEELKSKNEEAMSLNEEFLSTNEELESSKEELQSLNEELTTVNTQLRQALEQQEQASTDLSNLLNSSSVATIFLDSELRIKIFNPRMQALFSLIGSDIGRPLANLLPKFSDPTLLADATEAQSSGTPKEREIAAESGVWYLRTVAPYRIESGHIAGAVVTFSDVSRLKLAEMEATSARQTADQANRAKSRFLAAASHDLRQPLQAIELLQGVLERRVTDAESRTTLRLLDDAVAYMGELLDSLLDINRLESGEISAVIEDFPIAQVLVRACDEQAPVAAAKGLQLRTVASSLVVRSDPRLLARMIGNLLTNAIKYTDHGKVLVGCRRRGETVRIEVWDTGVGIAEDQLGAIFEEFYRVDATNSGKSGLGLGLYIVQEFARLLGHTVEVRSTPGRGAMFAVVVAPSDKAEARAVATHRTGEEAPDPAILVVEDEPRQREVLRSLLEMEGYRVTASGTGAEALAQLRPPASFRPRVMIVDYNLPGGMTGLDTVREVRRAMGEQVPALIISAGGSSAVRSAIEASGLVSFSKPVRTAELVSTVGALAGMARSGSQRGMRPRASPALVAEARAEARAEADVAVIEDEPGVRDAARRVLESEGHKVAIFPSAEAFFGDAERRRFRCLVVDLNLPGTDGLALLDRLKQEQSSTPVILMTGSGTLSSAVKAMREGAADFLQKPVAAEELRESVSRALASNEQLRNDRAQREEVVGRLASLTEREREVMERVVAGQASKNIAFQLGISERTVEHHRHSVMQKMGAKSLAILVRMVAPEVTGN